MKNDAKNAVIASALLRWGFRGSVYTTALIVTNAAFQPRRARSSEVSHDDMRAVGCKRLLGCRSPQG